MELDVQTIQELNREFAELVGIKKVQSFIVNTDTKEVRYYSYPSGAYKPPKGWTNITSTILSQPVYPDFIQPDNFIKLLNIQWNIFKSLGPQYNKICDESFEINYLINKIQGIKLAKSFGGGELLDEYLQTVRQTEFNYYITEEV